MKRLLVLALLTLAVGCGGSSDATAPSGGTKAPNVVGSYSIQTVGGLPAPGVLIPNYNGVKVEILSDRYMLNADHTWSETFTFRYTDLTTSAVATTPGADYGTYFQNNTALVFTGTTGSVSASISGSTLTLVDQGVALVYRKD